jgi:hypothetical protein
MNRVWWRGLDSTASELGPLQTFLNTAVHIQVSYSSMNSATSVLKKSILLHERNDTWERKL